MCGIWGCIGREATTDEIVDCQLALKNRGPEDVGLYNLKTLTLGFSRLALNGVGPDGNQPMIQGRLTWVCNGEIYNWKELADRLDLLCQSTSDCSVLGPLWAKLRDTPEQFFRALDGVFALILVDTDAGEVIVGRDPYGVRPLFYATQDGNTWIASEMKALKGKLPGVTIQHVKPGTYMRIQISSGLILDEQVWHSVPWIKNPVLHEARACNLIREGLEQAVRKRLMTERPVAALLSGGLDSSLIAALVQRELVALGKPALETFTVGFEGSPDVLFARQVARHIGSKHTEIIVTPDQFFEVIPEVIEDIETYDITSVRASVGNWFVSKEIRARSDAKVVFNGDGADELFGSYLYFFRSPDDESYEHEVGRLLTDIHKYDVLRSDRCISSHGLEPRTPFLDKQFVALVRSVPTELLRPRKDSEGRCEKWILRKAFESLGLLPNSVLWRQKEAFSDGVSGKTKSWYQEIQERIPDSEPKLTFSHLPPQTEEAYYYRSIFHEHYGVEGEQVISYFWMPKWSGETKDPSARTLSLY
jgi:asparagine synthase (glutamine-hydrolysing)